MGGWKRFLQAWGLPLALAGLLGGVFLFLRTPAGPLRTWADLESHLGVDRPVLVELYSNL